MWCKLTVKFGLYCKPCFSSQANSHHKVVDTEDIHNLSRRHRDGKITSETIRTEKHEELIRHVLRHNFVVLLLEYIKR